MAVDQEAIVRIVHDLLLAIGEDPERPGLADTPVRVARWWKEFIDEEHPHEGRTFEAVSTGQLVMVTGIPGWSLCEHHLLPFSVRVAIGYLPNGKVLGLSKFARVVRRVSRRLQLQERLTDEIRTRLSELTGTEDVAVHVRGVHLCMRMRGIESDGGMTTASLGGRFFSVPALRAEFLAAIGPE